MSVFALVACGGGTSTGGGTPDGGTTPPAGAGFTIGGTVNTAGAGGLVLGTGLEPNLTIPSSYEPPFAFANKEPTSTAYNDTRSPAVESRRRNNVTTSVEI